jgi:3-oxocholest-4-en-26-oyl-CoA dehydrogenase beta subunit
MDFELSHETEAVAELATRILTERSTSARLAELESGDDWVDRRTLKELADAGILGIALPEDVGGGGLGWLELHHVLEQVGATVAHVPLWETVVLGALPVARHGTGEQRRRLLPGVVAGERLLTGALVEPGPVDPRAPETRASREGDGWRLHGTKTQVPLAREADRILVSATTDDGHTGLFLVSPEQDGVELEYQRYRVGSAPCVPHPDGRTGQGRRRRRRGRRRLAVGRRAAPCRGGTGLDTVGRLRHGAQDVRRVHLGA